MIRKVGLRMAQHGMRVTSAQMKSLFASTLASIKFFQHDHDAWIDSSAEGGLSNVWCGE